MKGTIPSLVIVLIISTPITSQSSKKDGQVPDRKGYKEIIMYSLHYTVYHILYMSSIYWNGKLKSSFFIIIFLSLVWRFPHLYPCGKEGKHCWKTEIVPSTTGEGHNVSSDGKLELRSGADADRGADSASLQWTLRSSDDQVYISSW